MSRRNLIGARFCPWCGTETLERDDYRKDHGKVSKNGRSGYEFSSPEYTCSVCNRGFAVTISLRHQHALELLGEMRRLRPPVFDVDGKKM